MKYLIFLFALPTLISCTNASVSVTMSNKPTKSPSFSGMSNGNLTVSSQDQSYSFGGSCDPQTKKIEFSAFPVTTTSSDLKWANVKDYSLVDSSCVNGQFQLKFAASAFGVIPGDARKISISLRSYTDQAGYSDVAVVNLLVQADADNLYLKNDIAGSVSYLELKSSQTASDIDSFLLLADSVDQTHYAAYPQILGREAGVVFLIGTKNTSANPSQAVAQFYKWQSGALSQISNFTSSTASSPTLQITQPFSDLTSNLKHGYFSLTPNGIYYFGNSANPGAALSASTKLCYFAFENSQTSCSSQDVMLGSLVVVQERVFAIDAADMMFKEFTGFPASLVALTQSISSLPNTISADEWYRYYRIFDKYLIVEDGSNWNILAVPSDKTVAASSVKQVSHTSSTWNGYSLLYTDSFLDYFEAKETDPVLLFTAVSSGSYKLLEFDTSVLTLYPAAGVGRVYLQKEIDSKIYIASAWPANDCANGSPYRYGLAVISGTSTAGVVNGINSCEYIANVLSAYGYLILQIGNRVGYVGDGGIFQYLFDIAKNNDSYFKASNTTDEIELIKGRANSLIKFSGGELVYSYVDSSSLTYTLRHFNPLTLQSSDIATGAYLESVAHELGPHVEVLNLGDSFETINPFALLGESGFLFSVKQTSLSGTVNNDIYVSSSFTQSVW